MNITTHGQYLIQITRLTMMNCYLVREDDGFTLVDTGMGGTANDIMKAAQQFGLPIRRIALTHAHIDHIGSLDAVHDLLPDVEVLIGERESRFLAGDLSLDPSEQHDKLRGGFPGAKTKPTRLLKAGDRIGSLEVIASPGHTPGHMAFFDTRDRTLIAGDAYSTKGGIATPGTVRLLFPLPAMATWSKSVGLKSAEALRDLKPSHLAVGHGKVLTDPVPAMQQAIDDTKRSLKA